MKSALIATANREAVHVIGDYLRSQNQFDTDVVSSGDDLSALRDKNRYELIFIDLTLLLRGNESDPRTDYGEAIRRFRKSFPSGEIVVLSIQERLRDTVMAVKAGAANYLTFPVDQHEVGLIVESIQEADLLHSEIDYLRKKALKEDTIESVDARSPVMKNVIAKVKSVAPTKTTVLLSGETGTGKGLIARYMHLESHRRDRQFISLHCGALPDTLLESELFGHEKGSFTGASRKKRGKFELASGGTIFLDEIGTVTPVMQIKLLQVLQERSLQRVGSELTVEVDVRIIAATNEDLEEKCRKGEFRKDLFYRLNVFPIEVPPLRERKEDIEVLAEHILGKMNRLYGKKITRIDRDVLEGFKSYRWPGNIREMENLIERAYILENSTVLTRNNFPPDLFYGLESVGEMPLDVSLSLSALRKQAVFLVERQYLSEVLTRNRGSIKNSAKDAGITVRQLNKLMNKYGMRKEEFKSPPPGSEKPE